LVDRGRSSSTFFQKLLTKAVIKLFCPYLLLSKGVFAFANFGKNVSVRGGGHPQCRANARIGMAQKGIGSKLG
jgi:hypothetical protein